MLRSNNAVPVNVPNGSVSTRLVAVVYDGLAVSGALVVCRAVFRSKSAAGSAGFRYNVGEVVSGRVVGSIAVAVTPGAVGVFVELPWCQVMDLLPGDQIELAASTAGVDTWELDPNGFTVDVR